MPASSPTSKAVNDTAGVDAFMQSLAHPFKAEIEAVRAIILAANNKMSERIKWNAPSFFYVKDMAAFNPKQTKYAQLVLIFHEGAMIDDRMGLLEGDYRDRRLAHFHDAADLLAKKPALIRVVNQWIELIER